MKRKSISSRLLSALLTLVMIVSLVPITALEANAAGKSQVDLILDFAYSYVGTFKYSGYCQGFCMAAYKYAGIYPSYTPGSAAEACRLWKESDRIDNVPVGACVYAKGNSSNQHVGIYVGNGKVIDTDSKKGIQVRDLTWSWGGGYLGWGYCGRIKPDGEGDSADFTSGVYQINATPFLRIRTGPSTNYQKVGELTPGQVASIDKTQNGWGRIAGTGNWICLSYGYATRIGDLITKLDKPSVSVAPTGKIALASCVTVTWSAVNNATGYMVSLSDGQYKECTGTSATFKVTNLGTCTASVYAYADLSSGRIKSETGVSNGSFTVMAPVTVTFKDYDGTVIDSPRKVDYGASVTAPAVPARKGYTFAGWSRSLTGITADTDITATYKINTYTVNFVRYDKINKVSYTLSSQKVKFGDNAVPPTAAASAAAAEGTSFFGWDSTDYESVYTDNANRTITVTAVYALSSEYIPLAVSVNTPERQDDGYYVTFDITNNSSKTISGRAVVSLKTAEGKLVDMTESAAFSIRANTLKSGMEVFLPSVKAATSIEVIIVDNYSSGVPISAAKSKTVSNEQMWSNWSSVEPVDPDGTLRIETKTEYRYRDKETTTAKTKTLQGWVWDGTKNTTQYGWAQTTSAVTAVNTDSWLREVKTQSVTNYTQVPKYNYYRYAAYESATYGCPYWTNTHCNLYTYQFDYELSYGGQSSANGQTWYKWINNGSKALYQQGTFVTYTSVPSGSYTLYDYRDTYYTYNFYRWSDDAWSDWSTSEVIASDDRQVENRTVYRYMSTSATLEDDSGVQRTVSGTLGSDFAGKQVTLFVYKVDSASDYTNECVAQAVADASGNYSFSFKLREEPTVKTGDFTVALGVEGMSDIRVIDTIAAPKPVYTVKFYSMDGRVISTQNVTEGVSAVAPNVPEVEGYTFAGWEVSPTYVRENLDIKPVYIKKDYTVVYVDWENKTVQTRSFGYGDALAAIEVTAPEGMVFEGWDKIIDGTQTVTDTLILTAVYSVKSYTVRFFDYDLNVISTQTVNHGECPLIPDDLDEDGKTFLEWASSSDYTCIKCDTDVYPDFYYAETAETPVSSLQNGVYSGTKTVTLTCPTENSRIYYTTDGSDPQENGTLYTGPITIAMTTELSFCANADDMNYSETVKCYYSIINNNMQSEWMEYSSIPSYVLNSLGEYVLKNETGYRYKDVLVTSEKINGNNLLENGWTRGSFTYGDYSEWSTDIPNDSNSFMEIEQKDPDPVATPFYRYGHFVYSENGENVYSQTEVEGKNGTWEYVTLDSSLSISAFVSGQPAYRYNGVYYFNQEIVIRDVIPNYRLYRYRLMNYTYTKWTDWSVEAPAASDTRERVSATVFRFTAPEKYILEVVNPVLSETLMVSDEYSDYRFVIKGSHVSIDTAAYEREGYTLEGFFTDEACTSVWDFTNDTVGSSIKLYPKYTIKSYNVSFEYEDGEVIYSQTAEYGSFVMPPEEVTVPEGRVFTGWDSADYMFITGNTVVTAVVKGENEVVSVSLDRTRITTVKGVGIKLNATVSPANAVNKSLKWTTSNPAVAGVDQNGNVVVRRSGSAVITAVSLDNLSFASCVITVLADENTEILPQDNSGLDIVDEEGYLTGLDTDMNIWQLILALFKNDRQRLAAYKDGLNVVNGEEKIGTGVEIKLLDGDSNVDIITVVIDGDLNGDGVVDALDAVLGELEATYHYTNVGAFGKAADVDKNGYFDISDYSAILNKSVGISF